MFITGVLVLVTVLLYGYSISILSTLVLIMHKNTTQKETNSTQTEELRLKRSIFDTVLRIPENTFEKEASPMPIVDQETLLETLRAANIEGLINRQARSTGTSEEEASSSRQRQNDRGPLIQKD